MAHAVSEQTASPLHAALQPHSRSSPSQLRIRLRANLKKYAQLFDAHLNRAKIKKILQDEKDSSQAAKNSSQDGKDSQDKKDSSQDKKDEKDSSHSQDDNDFGYKFDAKVDSLLGFEYLDDCGTITDWELGQIDISGVSDPLVDDLICQVNKMARRFHISSTNESSIRKLVEEVLMNAIDEDSFKIHSEFPLPYPFKKRCAGNPPKVDYAILFADEELPWSIVDVKTPTTISSADSQILAYMCNAMPYLYFCGGLVIGVVTSFDSWNFYVLQLRTEVHDSPDSEYGHDFGSGIDIIVRKSMVLDYNWDTSTLNPSAASRIQIKQLIAVLRPLLAGENSMRDIAKIFSLDNPAFSLR